MRCVRRYLNTAVKGQSHEIQWEWNIFLKIFAFTFCFVVFSGSKCFGQSCGVSPVFVQFQLWPLVPTPVLGVKVAHRIFKNLLYALNKPAILVKVLVILFSLDFSFKIKNNNNNNKKISNIEKEKEIFVWGLQSYVFGAFLNFCFGFTHKGRAGTDFWIMIYCALLFFRSCATPPWLSSLSSSSSTTSFTEQPPRPTPIKTW